VNKQRSGYDHRDMVRRRMMVVANGVKRTLTEPRYRSGFMSTALACTRNLTAANV
jgi:hypothetical protein